MLSGGRSTMVRRAFPVLALAFAVGIPIAVAAGTVDDGSARSWIDAPLDGTTVTAGEVVVIVAHVSDPGGVTGAEITVGDRSLTAAAIDGAPTMALVERHWTPSVAGVHLLGVRATGPDGPGPVATVRVVVTGRAGPEPTSTPTTTPTTRPPSTPTARPTASPTPTPTPTPTCLPTPPAPASPATGSSVLTGATTLSWTYGGCTSVTYEVQVAADPRFRSPVAGATVSAASWTTPALPACATYWWRVRAVGDAGTSGWSSTSSYAIGRRTPC